MMRGMQPRQLPNALNRAGTAAGEGWARRQALEVGLGAAPCSLDPCGPDHPAQPQD